MSGVGAMAFLHATLMLLMGFGLAAGVFLVGCADVQHTGFRGKVSRLLSVQLPEMGHRAVVLFFGERAAAALEAALDWIVHKPNPLLQVLYHLILGACLMAWVAVGEPQLEGGGTLFVRTWGHGGWHSKWEPYVGITLCLGTWGLANFRGPGTVGCGNVHTFLHTAYDGLMFQQHNTCRTCKVVKPARSKHCPLCGHCVPLFDHHCVWLNQCVGEQNYRWFLLFLLVHAAVFSYFAVMLYYMLVSPIYQRQLWAVRMVDSRTQGTCACVALAPAPAPVHLFVSACACDFPLSFLFSSPHCVLRAVPAHRVDLGPNLFFALLVPACLHTIIPCPVLSSIAQQSVFPRIAWCCTSYLQSSGRWHCCSSPPPSSA